MKGRVDPHVLLCPGLNLGLRPLLCLRVAPLHLRVAPLRLRLLTLRLRDSPPLS